MKIETQHKMFLFFSFSFCKKKTRLCRSLFSHFLCALENYADLLKLRIVIVLFWHKLIRRLRTGLRCSGILQAHTVPQLGGCLLVCGQAWRRVCQHTHTWQAQLRWVYTHTHTYTYRKASILDTNPGGTHNGLTYLPLSWASAPTSASWISLCKWLALNPCQQMDMLQVEIYINVLRILNALLAHFSWRAWYNLKFSFN